MIITNFNITPGQDSLQETGELYLNELVQDLGPIFDKNDD